MSFRARISFVVIWIVSLVIVGVLASAQTIRREPTPAPVISGADIGFRPDGWRGNKRTGTWVVKINGEWVEVVDTVRSAPLTSR